MQAWDSQRACHVLYKVDVRTGAATFFERGAQATYGWLDPGRRAGGALRFQPPGHGGVDVHLAPGLQDWTLYRKLRRDEMRRCSDLEVIGSTPETGVLLVSSATRRRRRQGVAAVRPQQARARRRRRGQARARHHRRSLSTSAGVFDRRLVHRGPTRLLFFEPDMKTQFDQAVRGVPNDANLGFVDVSLDHKRFVLSTSSPTDPGSFWFYDAAGSLSLLGQTKPWLNGRLALDERAEAEEPRRPGPDGLSHPASPAKPPGRALVVVPHGGTGAAGRLQLRHLRPGLRRQGLGRPAGQFPRFGRLWPAFADAGRQALGRRDAERRRGRPRGGPGDGQDRHRPRGHLRRQLRRLRGPDGRGEDARRLSRRGRDRRRDPSRRLPGQRPRRGRRGFPDLSVLAPTTIGDPVADKALLAAGSPRPPGPRDQGAWCC